MKQASTFNELYEQISLRKLPFLMVFFAIVTISYGVLFVIDFIPEPVADTDQTTVTSVVSTVRQAIKRNGGLSPVVNEEPATSGDFKVVIPEKTDDDTEQQSNDSTANISALPVSITFDSLQGRTVTVLNPTSRAVADLDAALLTGVVRHPDSATFANPGNIFILGHSSYLPNVFNKNFQAFNGLQELTWGDTIRVNSEDTEYVYRVDRVYKAKASEVSVPITSGEAKLTLATCNSFASKDDRFIVEATLVDTNAL